MTIYIDVDFKCHVSDDGTMRTVETEAFNGRCASFIEGYRYVPDGETWVRDDGVSFSGEMIAPWKPYEQLLTIQDAVDRKDAERDAELAALIEEIYTEDLEVIG